jgi:transcriptional regulator with XRE-family HTH domain
MSGFGAERSFGALLRAARLDAALTQQDLATRCGMSVRAISDLERDRTRRPYLRSVRLLAEALNVPRPLRDAMLAASRCGERDGCVADQLPGLVMDFGGRPGMPMTDSAGLWHELRAQAGLLAAVAEQLVEAVAKTAALEQALTELRARASRAERDHRTDRLTGS